MSKSDTNGLLMMILGISIAINMLLAFEGIWLHISLHLKEDAIFYKDNFVFADISTPSYIWIFISVLIGFLDIIVFFWMRRTPILAFLGNLLFFTIGVVAMVIFIPQIAPLTELIPITILQIIDVLNGFISYRICIENQSIIKTRMNLSLSRSRSNR